MIKLSTSLLALLVMATASAFAAVAPAPAPNTGTADLTTSATGNTDQEVSAARDQAGQAATAKDVTAVHQDLQQVINCLAGHGGPGYDASIQDPCQGMGRGALLDVTAASDAHRLLSQAYSDAFEGLLARDAGAAQSQAKKALTDIEQAQKDAPPAAATGAAAPQHP